MINKEYTEIAKAMAQFRQNLKQPKKEADNPYFKSKYVPLEGVVAAIDEAIKDTGLAYSQYTQAFINSVTGEIDPSIIGVGTDIYHISGQKIECPPLYMKATKADPQGIGSAITYARRYSLSTAFGIASEPDDDGNTATHGSAAPKKGSQRSKDEPPLESYNRVQSSQTMQELHKQKAIESAWNCAKRAGLDQDFMAKHIKEAYKKSSSKDLTIKEAQEMEKHFEKIAKDLELAEIAIPSTDAKRIEI